MDTLKKQLINEPLLTVREVARRVCASKRSVDRLIARRLLHVVRFGPPMMDRAGRDHRRPLVPESEVERLLEVTPRLVFPGE